MLVVNYLIIFMYLDKGAGERAVPAAISLLFVQVPGWPTVLKHSTILHFMHKIMTYRKYVQHWMQHLTADEEDCSDSGSMFPDPFQDSLARGSPCGLGTPASPPNPPSRIEHRGSASANERRVRRRPWWWRRVSDGCRRGDTATSRTGTATTSDRSRRSCRWPSSRAAVSRTEDSRTSPVPTP